MPKYEVLSPEITETIRRDRENHQQPTVCFADSDVIRRQKLPKDDATVWRPTFVHDIDKILHCPYYNRYIDKTQVFSLYRNDDITRRSLHVQLVSRIARTIGSALHLNLDLIEAIALGHDIGHPPFAHTGEAYLDALSMQYTGRHFYHNIHSVRVLDKIFPLNISLQTLNGIAAHNGELECEEYRPVPLSGFDEFDRILEKCAADPDAVQKLMPCTLEGAVVRLSDIIAYLGKDRQDAARIQMIEQNAFPSSDIGTVNSEIINNLVVNIIENSYGKPYIKLDAKHFAAVKSVKRENYALIYENEPSRIKLEQMAKPMMTEIYEQLLEDLRLGKKNSPIFRHHIDYVNQSHYPRPVPYEQSEPNDIIVDYIASMTDDYLIDLYHFLFPNSPYHVEYTGYFTDLQCLE